VKIDVSHCPSPHSRGNQLGRLLWGLTSVLLFRPTPKILHGWRCLLLRLFGAKIGRAVHVHPSVRIWAPWNLRLDDYSCLGPDVDCYCVAPITIGAHATVSQYSYLCGASHDIEAPDLPLVSAPITIGEGAWITADVFVAPGVTIGEGAVVGARSSVFHDVAPWSVVAGNPARFLKARILKAA